MEEEERQILINSYGGKAVGLSFNPSNLLSVEITKSKYAKVINLLDSIRSETDNPEKKRLCSIAITEAQAAQMWAVKALTWKE